MGWRESRQKAAKPSRKATGRSKGGLPEGAAKEKTEAMERLNKAIDDYKTIMMDESLNRSFSGRDRVRFFVGDVFTSLALQQNALFPKIVDCVIVQPLSSSVFGVYITHRASYQGFVLSMGSSHEWADEMFEAYSKLKQYADRMAVADQNYCNLAVAQAEMAI